jgi:hypothetical protein
MEFDAMTERKKRRKCQNTSRQSKKNPGNEIYQLEIVKNIRQTIFDAMTA